MPSILARIREMLERVGFIRMCPDDPGETGRRFARIVLILRGFGENEEEKLFVFPKSYSAGRNEIIAIFYKDYSNVVVIQKNVDAVTATTLNLIKDEKENDEIIRAAAETTKTGEDVFLFIKESEGVGIKIDGRVYFIEKGKNYAEAVKKGEIKGDDLVGKINAVVGIVQEEKRFLTPVVPWAVPPWLKTIDEII